MNTFTLDRDQTIKSIRSALQKRSGKAWSVTGGRGTAWGWIRIDAPPARRTWLHRPRPGKGECPGPGVENWEEYDSQKPGGNTSPDDRLELASLLGLQTVHYQGQSIPASNAHRAEYVDRALGIVPTVLGEQYWD